MKKIIDVFGNFKITLFLGAIYAFAAGYATFIENDFGRATANVNVYYAWWFEALQTLLIISMIINAYKFKMFRLKKATTLCIHMGFVLVFLGGGLSHFFAMNGSLHIREGEKKSEFPIKNMEDKIIGTFKLPFEVKLTDFKLARYPGNNAPSTYESFIEIYEDGKLIKPFHIYMNNILVHKGFRFYQASYDQDELGTILAVTDDPGMWPTYLGYFILFMGLFLNLFDPSSLFSRLSNQLKKIQEEKAALLVIFFVLLFGLNRTVEANPKVAIDSFHANKVLGALPVQTFRGRIMPVDTISEEVMNKISKRTSFGDMNHNEMLLSIFLEPEYWKTQPLIYIHHPEIKERLKVDKKTKRVSYDQFFNSDGQFIFKKDSEVVQKTAPAKRGTFAKELIKVNERLNAFYTASLGNFYKALPDYSGNAAQWAPLGDALSTEAPVEYQKLMSQYLFLVKNGDWHGADKRIKQVAQWQVKFSPELVPNHNKIQWELLFNDWKIFQKLALFIAPFAFLFLIIGFVSTLTDKIREEKVHGFALGVAYISMAFFVFGLGLRWYIAGHAPISNGYESMVFIAWATLLAGMIFFMLRKNLLMLSVSMLFSSLALGVAHLSWMDPQIGALVPVLKSYWLTIHVSIITSSYGFLAVSACLGITNLILMILKKEGNKRTELTIKELNYYNHMSIFVGVALLTIGTFLGGIWANESWGSYWSWDPKETWSWVSILLYAILLHTYYVKKLYSVYLFSVLSVATFYSILMTYLGVNYYLAGLHSYAKGDPVPVPTWLYVVTFLIIVLFGLSYRKKKML